MSIKRCLEQYYDVCSAASLKAHDDWVKDEDNKELYLIVAMADEDEWEAADGLNKFNDMIATFRGKDDD